LSLPSGLDFFPRTINLDFRDHPALRAAWIAGADEDGIVVVGRSRLLRRPSHGATSGSMICCAVFRESKGAFFGSGFIANCWPFSPRIPLPARRVVFDERIHASCQEG